MYIKDCDMKLYMPMTGLAGNQGNTCGTETFRNDLMKSLTKEELQNSSDGKDPDTVGPVIVEFSVFDFPLCDLPDLDTLKSVMANNASYWNAYLQNDKRRVKFLQSCGMLLRGQYIRCLRVSDHNTVGLLGSTQPDISTPWNNLVRNNEVSDKLGSAGGSFGIGKSAAYANSELRCVGYNTCDKDGNVAFQIVLQMPSYKHNGCNYAGLGFYVPVGADETKILPIPENVSLDPNYQREMSDFGMDKYIIGFKHDVPLSVVCDYIITSSIDNFLVAFLEGKLEVRYDNIVINQDTVGDLVDKYSDMSRQIHLEQETIEQYEVRQNADKHLTVSIMEPDDVEIWFKLDPNYSRKAGIVRGNGMKVLDKGHIVGNIGFAAVVMLRGDTINRYFKQLENPEHNRWSLDRADDPREAKAYMDQMIAPLKREVRLLHDSNVADFVDADGMSEFLPYDYAYNEKYKMEGLSERARVVRKAVPLPPRKAKMEVKSSVTYDSETDESTEYLQAVDFSGGGGSYTPPPGGHGAAPVFNGSAGDIPSDVEVNPAGFSTVGLSDTGFSAKKQVTNDHVRCRLTRVGSEYHVGICCDTDIMAGFVSIFIAGEESNFKANVQSATLDGQPCLVWGNKIAVGGIDADKWVDLAFTIDLQDDFSFEVRIYAC